MTILAEPIVSYPIDNHQYTVFREDEYFDWQEWDIFPAYLPYTYTYSLVYPDETAAPGWIDLNIDEPNDIFQIVIYQGGVSEAMAGVYEFCLKGVTNDPFNNYEL